MIKQHLIIGTCTCFVKDCIWKWKLPLGRLRSDYSHLELDSLCENILGSLPLSQVHSGFITGTIAGDPIIYASSCMTKALTCWRITDCISNITSFPCPPPTPHPPTRDLCPGASIDRRRVSCVLAAQPATRPRQPGVQQRLCHVSPWQWWCWLVRLRVWQGIHGGSVITRSTIAKSEGLYKAIDK